MNYCVLPVTAFIGIICTSCVFAQDLTAELPPDGWWIRYGYAQKHESNGRSFENAGQMTFSLVGTVVEEGEKLRWIEVTSVVGNKLVAIEKFLIPEKELLENEEPLNVAKRAWRKTGNRDVQSVAITKNKKNSILSKILPGKWQQGQLSDDEKVIDYQRGRLKASEVRSFKITSPPKTRVVDGKKEELKTESEDSACFGQTVAPFIAAATFKTTFYNIDERRGTEVLDFVIEDYGTDSNSKLPDNH